jgi:uncharacterized membrane protein YGL010W
MYLVTENISKTKLHLTVLTIGIIIISAGIVVMGQILDKEIEGVMLIHDFYIVLALITGSIFIGLLYFANFVDREYQKRDAVLLAKILTVTALISAFIIQITGSIGYIEYRSPDPDSAKSQIKQTFPLAHDPMFETMEYLGLLGIIWTGLITYITWYFKEKIFRHTVLKNALISLTSLAIIYALFISFMGIVPTKIASVQG